METDPLHAFLRRAFCAHVWLMERLAARLPDGDAGRARLLHAKGYAEGYVQSAAQAMGEPDPFLPMPAAPSPDGVSWFDLGFSALLLELLVLHVQPVGAIGPEENTSYGACGEHFRRTRIEAFRRAKAEGPATLEARIRAFVVPGVEAWGEGFLKEAMSVLDGRVSKRRILKEGMAALADCGLPDDPWTYVEPQLDRHGKPFGVGRVKKLAVRAMLKLA